MSEAKGWTTDPGFTWLVEVGKYRPVIDRTYALDVVEAHRYVGTHQKTGNVVLTVRSG